MLPYIDMYLYVYLYVYPCASLSQGVCLGLVSVFVPLKVDDVSVYMFVANNIRHGSYRVDATPCKKPRAWPWHCEYTYTCT